MMLWFKAWKTVLRSQPRAFISCKCQCLLWVLGVKRVSHYRQDERNPPGNESGVHDNEARMQKGRWQEGNFAKFLEQFDSQDCVSRDNQHRYAEKVAANLPQTPEGAKTPRPGMPVATYYGGIISAPRQCLAHGRSSSNIFCMS